MCTEESPETNPWDSGDLGSWRSHPAMSLFVLVIAGSGGLGINLLNLSIPQSKTFEQVTQSPSSNPFPC